MATPLLIGVGAITAALVGRQMVKRAGQKAGEQWVKGGFKAKMDRREAVSILGLKYVPISIRWDKLLNRAAEMVQRCVTD